MLLYFLVLKDYTPAFKMPAFQIIESLRFEKISKIIWSNFNLYKRQKKIHRGLANSFTSMFHYPLAF